jgi:hypothetical protein
MTANRPGAAVWLDIPEGCHVSGEFTGDYDLHIVFGDLKDGVEMLFERPALERFVRPARELLAVPIPDDPDVAPAKLTAHVEPQQGEPRPAGARPA